MALVPEPRVLSQVTGMVLASVPRGFVVRTTSPQDSQGLMHPQTCGPRHPGRVKPPGPRLPRAPSLSPESLLPAHSHQAPSPSPTGACTFPRLRHWSVTWLLYVATCARVLLPPALHPRLLVCAGNGRVSHHRELVHSPQSLPKHTLPVCQGATAAGQGGQPCGVDW